jgi:pimeloyl-ACP methyl ester carboxylesterase
VWLDPGFRQWTIDAFLPAVHVPVLAIQGEKDPYGSQDQIDAIQRKVGGAVGVEVIPDCGHAPHLEKPDAVLKSISAFIQHLVNAID